jgi:acetyl esterase/lipase
MRLLSQAGRVAGLSFLLLVGTAAGHELLLARGSERVKNLAYVPASDSTFDTERHRVDVYAPKDRSGALRPVVVFFHGGSWASGNKNLYPYIGRRLAKQGYVAVLANYRLAPTVQVPAMADDCARAVLWVEQHIQEFGGDPKRIYLMGHSAGGGLAALLATDDALFQRRGQPVNPVRGTLLDDPAGLTMDSYLQKMEYDNDEQYLVPFGRNPAVWRQVSAIRHVRAGQAPFLLFVGGDTYPSIKKASREFRERLVKVGNPPEVVVIPGRSHVPMVLQLYFADNVIYRKLREFVKQSE